MDKQRITIAQKIALLFGSLLFCFVVIEIGYRFLDPFPFFGADEINHTEHGNLSTYDETLGWKGVPGGKTEHITKNNRVWIANNRHGFRDIEHKDQSKEKPAIVFLGDSFTWGYEVEFGEMFVNRLRERLPSYDIFNLAHRGYGTDQALLTFMRWRGNPPIKWVVLMFSPNDVADNNSSFRYSKPKPKFQIVDGNLVLTGVPVPMIEGWTRARSEKPTSWQTRLMKILFRSHALHDIAFRLYGLFRSHETESSQRNESKPADLNLTAGILAELKRVVEARGAKLVVFFIPSKIEIERWGDAEPYQHAIVDSCRKHGIEYFDLAADFKNTWFRTYHRKGAHWNAYGHQVAANAIYANLMLRR